MHNAGTLAASVNQKQALPVATQSRGFTKEVFLFGTFFGLAGTDTQVMGSTH